MSKRKIVISEHDNIAAIMENDRAVEFIIHRGDILLGDVFLTTVENILPSIDAAFVNVGSDKMGFLHASDVPGRGDLKKRLEPKQQLVVQVMKEPTGHKGPRVTTNISLPGRFLVMMPESKGISISRKIQSSKERARLKSAVSLTKPHGVGVIIRTEAEGQKESDLQEDFEVLMERWQNIVSMADTAKPPTLLYRDQDLLYRVIREAVTEDIDEIVLDSSFGLQRAQQLLQNWNLDSQIKATMYQGSQPVMIGTGVDRELRQALQTKVPLPSGGYLYIQNTEALTVVDVNSGKFTSLESQAATIRQTNLESCKEIARQLRLRNIGGMIVVDFIDMESRADQLAILETFENELAPDKSKPQVGQLTDLGLVEMTRHRQGQALSEIFTRRCKECHGTGHALDDLNWAPSSGGHSSGRHQRGNRHHNKLPVKNLRNQNVPKPNASPNKGNTKNSNPRNQDRDRNNNNRNQDRPQRNDVSSLENPADAVAVTEVAYTPVFVKKMKEQGNDAAQVKDLAEYFREKNQDAFGFQYCYVNKIACRPIEANSILSRINPKANDVVTLVNNIENAGHIAFHSQSDDDDDDDSDDQDNEQDNDQDSGTEKDQSSDDTSSDDSDDQEDVLRSKSTVRAIVEKDEPKASASATEKSRVAVKDRPEVEAEVVETVEAEDAEFEATDDDTETSEEVENKPKRRGRPPKKSNSRTTKK